MKLLSESLLKEYGFIDKSDKGGSLVIKIMAKDGIDIIIRNDGMYYSDPKGDHILRDSTALRKLYKEIMGTDLKPI